MIFYNGGTGSLGRYFAGGMTACGAQGQELRSRLEDRQGFSRELESHSHAVGGGERVWLVQMAARVSVPACERDPEGARKTNVTDTMATVADFVRWAVARRASPGVVYVSSGHVYASRPEGSRLTEHDPVEPRSEYARTKLAAEGVIAEHAGAHRYPLIIARVFGLLAPRQPPNYMLQGLIRRARERDLAGIPGLDFFRDFLDARDVCEILVRLCSTVAPAEPAGTTILNVCSGVPVQLREIVACILETLLGSEARSLASTLVGAAGRADDVPWIVGSPRLLEERLGYPARRLALSETVRDAVAAAIQPTTSS
jgi:nucleoside-diphosphate-sugar epimerase